MPVMNLPGIAPGQIKLTGARPGRHLPRRDHEVERSRSSQHSTRASTLPNLPITVVHRSDGSGTSFLFTTYLAMKAPGLGQRRSAPAMR